MPTGEDDGILPDPPEDWSLSQVAVALVVLGVFAAGLEVAIDCVKGACWFTMEPYVVNEVMRGEAD